jgi:hypothetical protein
MNKTILITVKHELLNSTQRWKKQSEKVIVPVLGAHKNTITEAQNSRWHMTKLLEVRRFRRAQLFLDFRLLSRIPLNGMLQALANCLSNIRGSALPLQFC